MLSGRASALAPRHPAPSSSEEDRKAVRGSVFPTDDGVCALGDGAGDLGEVSVRLGVGHDERGGGAARGADGSADAGRGVAGRARAAAARGPDAGQRALPADPGVRRKNGPLDRFPAWLTPGATPPAACRGRAPAGPGRPSRRSFSGRLPRASGSDFGCCGRTERRRNPSAASCLPTVRSCIVTPKRAAILSFRCNRRKPHHPVLGGVGPLPHHLRKLRLLLCAQPRPRPGRAAVRQLLQPGGVVAMDPFVGKPSTGRFSGPPHRKVCRSIPQLSAAVLRSFAIALEPMARRWLTLHHQRNRQHPPRRLRSRRRSRSPRAESSVRLIATAIQPCLLRWHAITAQSRRKPCASQ